MGFAARQLSGEARQYRLDFCRHLGCESIVAMDLVIGLELNQHGDPHENPVDTQRLGSELLGDSRYQKVLARLFYFK